MRRLTASVLGLPLLAAHAGGDSSALPERPLPAASLCVTEGKIRELDNGRAAVSVPKMRAYAQQGGSDFADLQFRYRGPTEVLQALASGAERVQLGLKLRAQDACNLVYVMWRVEPRSELVVSVKSNPGQRLSSECGNHGYRDLKPQLSSPLPRLVNGEPHRLRAEIRSEELWVFADEHAVWRGPLDSTAKGFHGPVGLRTDNAGMEFALGVDESRASLSHPVRECRNGPETAD
jgi:hypothetical protein